MFHHMNAINIFFPSLIRSYRIFKLLLCFGNLKDKGKANSVSFCGRARDRWRKNSNQEAIKHYWCMLYITLV